MGFIILLLCGVIFRNQTVDGKAVVDYISFVSLLLSIVLSIFAIQYTYTSNIQTQLQFDKINQAAQNMQDQTRVLSDKIAGLNQNLSTVNDTVNEILKQSRGMNVLIKDIHVHQSQFQQNGPNLATLSEEMPADQMSSVVGE